MNGMKQGEERGQFCGWKWSFSPDTKGIRQVDKYQRPISRYKVDLCRSEPCIVTRTMVDTIQDLKELRYLEILWVPVDASLETTSAFLSLERCDFERAFPFALDSLAAFISRGAVVRICLIWFWTYNLAGMDDNQGAVTGAIESTIVANRSTEIVEQAYENDDQKLNLWGYDDVHWWQGQPAFVHRRPGQVSFLLLWAKLLIQLGENLVVTCYISRQDGESDQWE